MRIEIFSNDPIMNISVFIYLVLFLFLSFLTLSFFLSLLRKKKAYNWVNNPVTIIVPAYNEENNIRECIDSIIRSDYEKYELLIVDDGSIDRTREIVREIMKDNPDKDISLINGKHEGKSKALNLAVKQAKYEYLLTIDADIVIEKDTVQKLIAPLSADNVAATNCVAVIRNPKGLLENFQRIEFFMNNLIRVSFSKVYDNSIWFFGAVACYKKKILKEVGYFKTDTLTEDMDLCLELFNARYKIITVSDAIITTTAMQSVKDLFRQRMRWYYGALQSLFKNYKLLFRRSPAVYFLFFNQYWWTIFAFISFFIVAYQFNYWFPSGQGIFESVSYTVRWFSLAGPFYVLYKIPEWGLSLLNIFGVLSGIISLIMALSAIRMFRGKITIGTIPALFFYFPYTILMNAIVVSGVVKYLRSKKKYFID